MCHSGASKQMSEKSKEVNYFKQKKVIMGICQCFFDEDLEGSNDMFFRSSYLQSVFAFYTFKERKNVAFVIVRRAKTFLTIERLAKYMTESNLSEWSLVYFDSYG